ncbi:MAG: lysylphosphatidylglycerol synthase domain-containing protein [Rhodospirillaceae bacterium]
MKLASYIGLVVGLVVLTGLIVSEGIGDITGLLLASGWSLLWVPAIWFPTVLMNARCWQLLFHPDRAPTFFQAFYAQWMGRAVNTLLPVASIGGEIVKARVLVLWGLDARHAAASAVVDKTVQVITIIVWGVIGVSLLAVMALDDDLVVSALIGMALLGAGVAGFFVVQKAGMFGIVARSAHKVTSSDTVAGFVDKADEVDAIVHEVYARRGPLAAAVAWRMLALVLQSGEVWLAAQLLGFPIGIVEAVMLKSLSSTLSDAAFVVPNSYGVQEGAFVVLGGLIGMPADMALAVSLAIRIRELLIDVPGLVFWQHAEGRAFFRRRQAGNPDNLQN